jgi:hypothetical protein
VDFQSLSKEEKTRLYVALLDAATPLVWQRNAADEVVHETFVRLLERQPWTKEPTKTLKEHAWVILEEVVSERRIAGLRRRAAEDRFTAQPQGGLYGGGSVEDDVIERDNAESTKAQREEWAVAIRERVLDNELDTALCDLMAKGIWKRADLVAKTGRTDNEVKTSLARIRRLMSGIVSAESGESEEESS